MIFGELYLSMCLLCVCDSILPVTINVHYVHLSIDLRRASAKCCCCSTKTAPEGSQLSSSKPVLPNVCCSISIASTSPLPYAPMNNALSLVTKTDAEDARPSLSAGPLRLYLYSAQLPTKSQSKLAVSAERAAH